MPTRFLAVFLLFVTAIGLSGCEGEDEADIRACYFDFATACEDGDPDLALRRMSADAIQHYDNLVKIARTGVKEQVRGLPPHSMFDVMFIRHAIPADERQSLDGSGYIRFMTSNGMWSRANGWEELTKIKVRKNSATAVIPNESKGGGSSARYVRGRTAVAKAIVSAANDPGGIKLDFLREDGAWKIDFTRFMEDRGREFLAFASNEGVDLFPYMCKKLENVTGKTPRHDILDRP